MMNKERMEAGLIYNPSDEAIMNEQSVYVQKLWEFNRLSPSQTREKEAYMHSVFAECGENCYIELPLHANWGGAHLHLGDNVYVNFSLTLVDDGQIYIGSHTMIGPNVTLATANHPVNEDLRYRGLQYNKDIHIGENCWLGAGVVVCPGVSIGEGSVIGAGSVVTRDIPAHVVAVGNPCRVMRPVGEKDKIYFYKNEPIDWENLPE